VVVFWLQAASNASTKIRAAAAPALGCFDMPHPLPPAFGANAAAKARRCPLEVYYTPMQRDSSASLYEFFCGGGLARLGLEPDFACVFANDIDRAKTRAYAAAFGDADLRQGDIWALNPADLPGHAALAWASFPCQDLSLAGARGGLNAARSGTFWGFYRLIEALVREDRAPSVLALENVTGLLNSHGGEDFAALVVALDALGYRVGALEIDAALFTPQSRQRLFIVATRMAAPPHLIARGPSEPFHSEALQEAVAA